VCRWRAGVKSKHLKFIPARQTFQYTGWAGKLVHFLSIETFWWGFCPHKCPIYRRQHHCRFPAYFHNSNSITTIQPFKEVIHNLIVHSFPWRALCFSHNSLGKKQSRPVQPNTTNWTFQRRAKTVSKWPRSE
jgi:hypothetical protein